MSTTIKPYTLRCEIPLYNFKTPFKDSRTGQPPCVPAGNDAVLQGLLLFDANPSAPVLADVSTITTITAEIQAATRTNAPFARVTLGAVDLDDTVDAATWADGSKQHFEIPFTPLDLELTATVAGTKYYLVLYATLDDGSRVTLAQTELEIVRDNVPDNDVLPVQAGNLVGNGAVYDGSGEYEITGLVAGRALRWSQGANDISLTNGGATINTSGQNFFTNTTSITLNGTPGQPVTAVVWSSSFFTADETAALITSLAGSFTGNHSGSGSPEGVVTAAPGQSYLDIAGDSLWFKKTGLGNTGWKQFIAL